MRRYVARGYALSVLNSRYGTLALEAACRDATRIGNGAARHSPCADLAQAAGCPRPVQHPIIVSVSKINGRRNQHRYAVDWHRPKASRDMKSCPCLGSDTWTIPRSRLYCKACGTRPHRAGSLGVSAHPPKATGTSITWASLFCSGQTSCLGWAKTQLTDTPMAPHLLFYGYLFCYTRGR